MTRTATAPLIALLNAGGRIDFADLYTVTLLGGTIIRWSGADRAIPWAGNTYVLGPLIMRDKVKVQIGVQVDTMQVTFNAEGAQGAINGVGLMSFIANGGFDGARIRCDRLYFNGPFSAGGVGILNMFSGRMGDVKAGRHECKVTVTSDIELLDAMVPRNLWQPGCVNTLYDDACGVNRASKTVTNAVTGSPAPTKYVFDSSLAQATGYFDLGVVTFTSGPNAGVARTVKQFVSGGLITLMSPLPFAPVTGNTFSIYPGCDKTQTTCNGKFAALSRFRGAPYIPVPETVT